MEKSLKEYGVSGVTGESLIAGVASGEGAGTFRAVDPRSGEAFGPEVREATAGEVARAVVAADQAFVMLRGWSPERRAELLSAIAKQLESVGGVLVEVADRETALGVSPRLEGELARTTGQLEAFARWVGEGRHLDPVIDTGGPDVRRSYVPVGPVGVFGASNFPLAFGVAGGDTASALAAGCPVVAKGHPSHPGTSELVGRAIVAACEAAGAPAGTFSLVQGASIEVGRALVLAPQVKAVGFTGSLAGGRALADLAAGREEPIPVYAEMGSVNPLFVLPRAAATRAARIGIDFAGSMTLGNGQFCTKPGILVVPDNQAGRQVVDAVADALDGVSVGAMLNARIAHAYRDDIQRLSARDGVEVVREVDAAPDGGPLACRPVLLRVDVDTFLSDQDLQDEHFGPTCVVVRCPVQRFAEVAEALPGSLTAAIHADEADLDAAAGLQQVLTDRAGRIIYNGYPTGVAVVPSMHHGGPYPATTQPGHTSVGATAIRRFLRPVAFQDAPDRMLPPELQDANPLGIPRLVDWTWTSDPIEL